MQAKFTVLVEIDRDTYMDKEDTPLGDEDLREVLKEEFVDNTLDIDFNKVTVELLPN